MERSSRSSWGSVLAGIGSVVTLPLAVYLTRFSDRYDLLDAGFAIPVAVVLGIAAVALSRRTRMRSAVSLDGGRSRSATAGHVLGVLGLLLAASAVVALGTYWLLEYVGSSD